TYYNRRTYARTNTGEPRDRADWIAIAVPPCIPAATWERAQAMLRRNARVLVGRPPVRTYLLRGLCRCECGSALVGQSSHGHRLYRCASRYYRIDGEPRCTAPSIGAKRLEEAVWTAVTATLRDPAVLDSTAKASRLGIEAHQVDARQQATMTQRALGQVT